MNLAVFNNNLFEAGTELFKQLGIPLNSNTASSLEANTLLRDNYKDKEIFQAIDETYFLGLVDDSVFAGKSPLLTKEKISLKEAEDRLFAEYNGLMVFAVRLKDSHSPTRGEIADLTRAFNRVSKSVPVVLLLKYGGLLSFAASERTKYKQVWREGEKIGKISLLKDINIAKPHTGHLKILDDLKVAPAVTDFNALYKQWQEVFNVQLLNKKFYQEIFYWYLWAVKEVKFPQMRPKEDLIPDDAHQSESVIRLLTRLLFCWFMKEKQELIPELLFDKREVKKILNDFSPENEKSSVFYRAILQNLFFATLSVPIKNRKYIRESFQGKNKDYGNSYVYRYQSEFADAKENLRLFKDIPFLNGGLFECLDEVPENDNEKEIRLDGFSSKEKKQAFVPDYLFWGKHEGIDLSVELDKPQKKNETVHGIIDILNSYKFTIEENTPLEEEIALDPELLGKVFESLLAYYNPETKANARKQTGSFYTPREIVNYMVDESLFATFQQKLGNAGVTENVEPRLRDLISYNETENPFAEKETNIIIQALENLKVLDPACGSGAFPMGILHKLVWVLQKIDPDNKKWFESIIKRLPDYAQSEMRKKLEGENWDYLRKLGIIQQSVYGVDIQPIAIQIAKLRFFISLLVDQDIKSDSADNFGLMPLPNLDFKLVSANTLIAAPEQSRQNDGKLFFGQDDFFDKFNALTGQYFGTYEPAEKRKLVKKIEIIVSGKVQEKVDEIQRLGTHTDERFSKHVAEKNKAVIAQKRNDAKLWQSYNNLFKHESVGFFETKYFFPEVKDGFDVVIGNPPYVQIKQIPWSDRKIYENKFNSAVGRFNLFYFFLELSSKIAKPLGLSTFIVPDRLLLNTQCDYLRKWLLKEQTILEIDSFAEGVFDAVVDSIIIIYENVSSNAENIKAKNQVALEFLEQNSAIEIPVSYFLNSPNTQFDLSYQPSISKLLDKIKAQSISLGKVSEIKDGIIQGKVADKLFLDDPLDNNSKPLLFGEDITRYSIRFNNKWVNYKPDEMMQLEVKRRGPGVRHGLWMRTPEIFERKKILTRQTADEIIAVYDSKNYYYSNTLHGTTIINPSCHPLYVLALLNSKLMTWYYRRTTAEEGKVFAQIKIELLRLLPIKEISSDFQQPFITLVDQILNAKTTPPSAPLLSKAGSKGAVDTSALEKQIDEMVYALYGLTPEEIALVEGKK